MASRRIQSLVLFFLIVIFSVISFSPQVYASHSWDDFHWARTSNPFTLKLGDNLSSLLWDPYLLTASDDWSASGVLDTVIVPGGTTQKRCRPTSGRVEVCNNRYGNNGWLGIAQIWASGNHITQGVAKLNDTYFNSSTYNTPAWKKLVMCQEIAHTFGLDHQDENFANQNLGTCMDYTSNPLGPPSNEHPNQHDYDMLVTLYTHLDAITTIGQASALKRQKEATDVNNDSEDNDPKKWGKKIKDNGKVSLYELDFGGGFKQFTFVIWANPAAILSSVLESLQSLPFAK